MSYLSTCLADSPNVIYLLNEAGGVSGAGSTIDSSGNSENGTPNAVTSGVSGPGGAHAYSFVSASTASVAGPGGSYFSPGTSAFSVEAWINTTAADSTPYIWCGTDGIVIWSLNFRTGDQKAQFRCGGASISGSVALNDGNWHQLFGTRDGSGNLILSVDGASVATGTDTTNLPSLTTLTIGSLGSFGGFYWDGKIAQCSYYPSALSSSRVAAHFLAGGGTLIAATYYSTPTSIPVYFTDFGGFSFDASELRSDF